MLLKHLRLSNHTIWWHNLRRKFTDFLARYIIVQTLRKVSWKSLRQKLAEIFLTDRRGTVAYLKIYDEVTEYTRHSVDSHNWVSCVTIDIRISMRDMQMRRAASTKRILRLARDVSHRCDIFATGICIRLPAVSRSRCHLKDGIGNENDSSADRCNFTTIGIRLSKHFVTQEALRIL